MKNKKSIAWGFIVMGIIAVTVALVILVIEPALLRKGGAEASNLISSTGDYDGDKISDYFDKCACLASEVNDGCPENEPITGPAAKEREEKCKKEIQVAKSSK